jgi:hypothetical protein
MRADAPYFFEDIFTPEGYTQGPYAEALKRRQGEDSALQAWEQKLQEYEQKDWESLHQDHVGPFIQEFLVHLPIAKGKEDRMGKVASKAFLRDPILFVEHYRRLAPGLLGGALEPFDALSACYSLRLCCSRFPFSSHYIPKARIESVEKELFPRMMGTGSSS